jgi:hypothetical protein
LLSEIQKIFPHMMSSRLKLNLKQQYKRCFSVIDRKLFVGWKIATNLWERERERGREKAAKFQFCKSSSWMLERSAAQVWSLMKKKNNHELINLLSPPLLCSHWRFTTSFWWVVVSKRHYFLLRNLCYPTLEWHFVFEQSEMLL